MFRPLALVLATLVLIVIAEPDSESEGNYGLRYGQRQREGRREAAETSGRFTPSQEVEEAQQQDSGAAGSVNTRYRQRQRGNRHQQEPLAEDSNSDGSSYRTVVLHDNPENQRPNLQYQNIRKKPTKYRPKVHRQNLHESSSIYKSLKNTKPADPSPYSSTALPPTTPVPGDPFVHAVHPSIMQSLLKQQPQTFDVPQDKETDNFEQGPINWQSPEAIQKSNNNQGSKEYQTDSGPQRNLASQQENYDASKRPIYVPNRVSVQSPSSDTSFNVGYSIGFGNGLVQPPRAGIVQPPVNFRHGKELSLPASFQNAPINVHIDGKNSVWKHMGTGIEMSHNLDQKLESPTSYNREITNDQNTYSSGSVINQPIFFREGFDHNFNSISTSGRNNFDHNHALQQSNSFDFSNAIDPVTNLPYTTQQKSNQFVNVLQPSYVESFSKQPFSSFAESVSKYPHSSYSGAFPKQSKPIYVESQPKYESSSAGSPQYTQAVLDPERPKSDGVKYEEPKYEKPSFSTSSLGSVRTSNSIGLNTKPKTTDYPKSSPGVAKSSYSFKTFSNNNNGINHFSDDMFGNNFGFPSTPILPPLYSPSGKNTPPGMVQAILVPVNAPSPSLFNPIGMPVMSSGYSPYFGHPIGMVRIPETGGVELPHKEEFESPLFRVNSQEENQQYQPNVHRSPVKFVQTQYVTRHHNEEPSDSSHHRFNIPSHSTHPRAEEVPEQNTSSKFKRVYTTEAPDHTPSSVKSYSPSSVRTSSYESPSFKEPSTLHYTINTHHSRPYRAKQMIIVKRS